MPLSRDELRAQLKAALNGDGKSSKASKAAAKPVSPSKNGNPFARKSRVVEVEEVKEDEAVVAVADEDEDEEVVEDGSVVDEPETTPMDEVVDSLVALVDTVMNHGEAIKSYLNSCR